ncbi:MAG: nicotinate-nucleotide adenylyltransferase [Acaryochloridaceae cyanobacterium RL_2_7]|nr:nicotinate-nucleotide adenylyltransferase [Acaryochloridaceae cyanobacterium RL_2_7]
MTQTIALFGTSADPPTIAHQAIIQWLSGQFDRVLIWAVDNPFKANQTPLHFRQQMMEILRDTMEIPVSNVYCMPELSDRRSLKSVLQVTAQWPNATLTLVVGADILPSLPDWYRIDDLVQRVSFLMVQRPDFEIDATQLEAVREMGGHIEVADFQGPKASSSEFRLHQTLALVPPSILSYLQEHPLYQAQGSHV